MSSDNRNYDPGFNLNSTILLVTIVTFSIIILIVLAFHLYTRFIIRRNRSEDLSDVVSQPPKRGLDSLVIASLPKFVVGVSDDLAPTECPVCLSLFEEKDMARMLPNCKHVFHVICVDTWLTTGSTCPVCRNEVEPRPRLDPEPREGPVGDFTVTISSSFSLGETQGRL